MVTDPALWELIIKVCGCTRPLQQGGLLGSIQDMPIAKSRLAGLIRCFQFAVCRRPRVYASRRGGTSPEWVDGLSVHERISTGDGQVGCAVCSMWFNKN